MAKSGNFMRIVIILFVLITLSSMYYFKKKDNGGNVAAGLSETFPAMVDFGSHG